MSHSILFVDDEPHILKGLERGLHDKAGEWDMRFAPSGLAAKAELERRPADIIVTDYRMPGMNGANLLDWVRRYSPGTIRFMLSGQFDTQAGLRTVPVAHQFLSKPCEPEVLIGMLDRACNLRKLLPCDVVRKVSAAVGSLPHNPAVYSRLAVAINDAKVNVKTISTIIEEDVSLTMKVLQLANSSFFAPPQAINSIGEAIQSLGLDLLQQLVLAVEVFQRPGVSQWAQGFSRQNLHDHSLLCARIAQTLLAAPGFGYSASVAALLHDIGQLVLACEMPQVYGQILAAAAEGKEEISTIERTMLGASHEEVGAYLAGLWGFPEAVVSAILHHHGAPTAEQCGDSIGTDGKVRNLDVIVMLADHLAGQQRALPERLAPYMPRWRAMAESLAERAGK